MRKNLLITGVTGILGRALAMEALAQDFNLMFLVRAESDVVALKRVLNVLSIDSQNDRIQVYAADIEHSTLGLHSKDYVKLVNSTHYVLHCAGNVSFNSQDKEAIFKANVSGTKHVLEFARFCLNLQGFIHISTAYVCGDNEGIMLEGKLSNGQSFSSPYEESKYQAELLVENFKANTGIPTLIFRPSIILENASKLKLTRLPAINALVLFLYKIAQTARQKFNGQQTIRIPVNPYGIIDLVQIDFVAETILKLLQCPNAYGQTYHLTNPKSPYLSELIAVLSEEVGHGEILFECVHPNDIELPEFNPVETMILLNMQPYLAHVSNVSIFDTQNLQAIRSACDFPQCRPVTKSFITELISESIQYAEC